MATHLWQKIIIILFIVAFLLAAGLAYYYWQQTLTFEPSIYYYVPPGLSFLYNGTRVGKFGFEEHIAEKITTERNRLMVAGQSFIDVDLKNMRLALYKDGQEYQNFIIQSKGREGSWWQTAPGAYFAGDKIVNHFSSVSGVWMPYAVQFYGNFFIHGWPFDRAGRQLPPGPSAGCVRLRTPDAMVVFEFAERGMPVLVFDKKDQAPLPALLPGVAGISFPELHSQALLIADLDTGEILLDRKADSDIYAGSLNKIMLALTASEIINLERSITARTWMIEGIGENIIKANRSYKAGSLLNPLLANSSHEAAAVLSRFFTADHFVAAMNVKAGAIGMNNSYFVDIVGQSAENKTNLYDVAKMMRYISQYRGFLLDINSQLREKNEDGTESFFAVWQMNYLKEGFSPSQRNIFISLVNSPDLENDYKNILFWLNHSLNLTQ